MGIVIIQLKSIVYFKLLETYTFLHRNNSVLLTNYCLVFWGSPAGPLTPPPGNFEGFLKVPRVGTGVFPGHMVEYMKEKLLVIIQINSKPNIHQPLI